jgi:hypothetical protein
VKSTFPEAQVLACATDKPRSECLPVTYEKLHLSVTSHKLQKKLHSLED